MIDSITYILDKLWPIFIAVIVTQWITQKFIEMRKPKLEMIPEGVLPNSLKFFSDGKVQSELPYHMWRIKVQHVKIPWHTGCLIKNRESALQCKADLTFYNSKDQTLFSMQGRWASSPEISHISPFNQQEKIIYPDTISVGYDSYEQLDCIVKFNNDKEAYGWNNESYATNGRNPRCKLEIGTYKVLVRISGQNFQGFSKKISIVIDNDWQGTSLNLIK